MPRKLPVIQAYLAAVLAASLALGTRFALVPVIGDRYPLLLFLPCALLTAWFFGSGPGLAALLLGYFAGDYFLVAPLFSFGPRNEGEFIILTSYLITGFVSLFAVSALRHYIQVNAAAQRERAELERQIQERLVAEKSAEQARDKLAALNATLEQNVAERTKALLATTEDLNSFCYSVAHDLKAPLRAQASFAEVLLMEYSAQLGEKGCTLVHHISDAALRQSHLVDDLLAHLSISRAEQILESVELRPLVAQVIADLRPLMREKKAMIRSSGLPDWRVVANEASLGLVVQNLLTNACKFVRPHVRPIIKLWSERRDRVVRVSVRDNGIGIQPEYHQQIFEVFQRLHSASAYPGTGIGLAIVKRAIERMHGTVGVQSQEGKGSTFWFELPLANGASQSKHSAAASRSLVHAHC